MRQVRSLGFKFRSLVFGLMMVMTAGSAAAQSLTVMTHDSFSLPLALVEEFTAETGIEVEFISGGDAGQVVNRAILTKARPIADLLFGVDDNLLERARSEQIFEPYLSPELQRVPEELWLDPDGLVTPVDVGYVTLNLDLAWFEERGVAVPGSLAALTDDEYAGTLVALNPASSSPGLAFMLATIARFGDPAAGIEPATANTQDGATDGDPGGEGRDAPAGSAQGFSDWLDFWTALRDNGLSVTDGWTDAYYTVFSRYGGDRPLVVSYATSPAAEVIFAEEPLPAGEPGPTANLQCAGCAYRQVEGIGILAGTDDGEAARAFIDFLLSVPVQEAIPLEMFVAPVVEDATVPEEFERFAALAEGVVARPLAPATVQANQQRWLAQWTAVVMQERDPASVR